MLGVYVMSKVVDLCDFPVGELGEIVDLEQDEAIFHEFGASRGMSVVILHKAAQWLVQIGYTQVSMGWEYLNKIKVKPANI